MDNNSPKLLELMNVEGKKQCRMVFGPRGRYCAWKAKGSWTKCYTDPYDDVKQTMDRTWALAVAALGVDYAYFFLQKDGKFWYNLRGNYDALEEIMKDLRAGDIEV